MSDQLLRRQFLKAGVGFIAGTGSAVLFSDFTAVLAQSTGQRDWRFCHKCQTMFFDGFPTKGVCATGGVHEAAGYNFVLPHDIAETATAQKNWRFCRKCQAMFFDGFPTKGVCKAGGSHEAAGFNFVLPHETDYLGKVANYLKNPSAMQNVIGTIWDNVGRGITADQIQKAINGKEFQHGVSAYNAHANLGNIQSTWTGNSPSLISVQINAPGNDVEFKTTTPSIFGSYADPSFRVGFGLIVNLTVSVTNTNNPIQINSLNVQVNNGSVHGSNAVGTLIETVADFFSGGGFSRKIVSQINQNQDLKNNVAQAIKSTLNNIW